MNRLLVPVLFCTLSACSTPQQGVRIETVQVPVPQPCLPASDIPVEPPLVSDELTGNASSDLPIIASSALLLRGWGRLMHGALVACADTPDR